MHRVVPPQAPRGGPPAHAPKGETSHPPHGSPLDGPPVSPPAIPPWFGIGEREAAEFSDPPRRKVGEVILAAIPK